MTTRHRSYSWQSPANAGDQAHHHLSGLDFLRQLIDRHLPGPPIAATLGFDLHRVEDGRAVFTAVPAEYHYNPLGTVHGGFFGTLLDSAMGCAVHTTLKPGEGYTTLEYKVNLVRPLTAAVAEVCCEGWVVHRGSRVATAEGRLVDNGGKLYAHGSTTCMIFANWGARDAGKGA